MQQRFIDYSRVVSVMAQQNVLHPDMAVEFCGNILPQLIAELEVLQRLADTKLGSVFTVDAPAVEPPAAECEATVCSSRWGKAETPAPKAKKAKKAKRTRKARKPENDHADA